MKTTLKAFAIAFLAATAMAPAAKAETLKVAFGAEPYPPMYYPDASGKWQGFEIELADVVCEAAGLKCETVPIAWDGIIPALTSGKVDMIMGSMSITDERKKRVDFSDKYYKIPPMIIGGKDAKFDVTPEGMADKAIGVQVSTTHQAYVEKYFVPKGATLKEYQTQDEANNDLAAGRLDAVMADSSALIDFLNTDVGKTCCENKGTPADDVGILGQGVGVAVRKGEDGLRDKLNVAIKKIRENGEYDRVAKKYFTFDVFGQ
ncbi:transporter substrate-binding domain-containing protein [Brucella sp. NBRC 12950]|uniref:transporter substrate-binding domain-containing protein n=1 Tax=Brucella sp. NBRC 12950 TaxID=2994518 RepID=UPI0024A48F27|nr:transporter substrate-binding domain-containing protein [Brucella sp. NBRC 12950]GLU25490.1 amino acid ABC transporter [Brucella sp. NBRC 12950]